VLTEAAEKRVKTGIISDRIPSYSWYALGLLTIVYILNFLDRTLIYILFTPIKKELLLSDLQLALLGTTSFVIFYTLMGIPFGKMADRVVRKNMIAIGLAVWSIFSGLTGFADNFWTIFLCRVMVGVGEATLGPAAFSLLSDYFPLRMRATVQAIYCAAIPLGAGLAFFLGGWIGQAHGWRWAFYLLGFPGLLFAIAVLFLREPIRGLTESAQLHLSSSDWKTLFRSVPLRYHNVGYALFAIAANSLSIWGPSFFSRVHGLSLAMIGLLGGVLSAVGGIPGTIMGGYVADLFRRKMKGGRMFFTACGALCCVPLWLIFLFSNNIYLLLFANLILIGVGLIWLGPAVADVHDIAGPKLRGIGVGIYLFIVNVIGYGIGPPIVGKLNDWLGVESDPTKMKYSLLVSPISCALSAVLLWLGSRKLNRSVGKE
jgi:MFS family permease